MRIGVISECNVIGGLAEEMKDMKTVMSFDMIDYPQPELVPLTEPNVDVFCNVEEHDKILNANFDVVLLHRSASIPIPKRLKELFLKLREKGTKNFIEYHQLFEEDTSFIDGIIVHQPFHIGILNKGAQNKARYIPIRIPEINSFEKIPQDCLTIGTLGFVHLFKGHLMLADLCKKMGYNFISLGSGIYSPIFMQRLRNEFPKFSFIEKEKFEDYYSYLPYIDILVFPTFVDVLGGSGAANYGIGTGIPTIIGSSNKFFDLRDTCPVISNVHELNKEIKKIMEDESERKSIIFLQKVRQKERSFKNRAKMLMDFFREVLSG